MRDSNQAPMGTADIVGLLSQRIEGIGIAEPAIQGDTIDDALASTVTAHAVSGILSVVARFLADHSGLLPDKVAVIDAVNLAVDAFLAASGRPILTRLIGPSVKQMLSRAVDAMYDAILNTRTEV